MGISHEYITVVDPTRHELLLVQEIAEKPWLKTPEYVLYFVFTSFHFIDCKSNFRPEDDEIPSLLLKFPAQPSSPEAKSPSEGQSQGKREKRGHGARRLIDRRVKFFASKQPSTVDATSEQAISEPLSAAAGNGKKACSASEDECGVEVGETKLTIICRLLQVGCYY